MNNELGRSLVIYLLSGTNDLRNSYSILTSEKQGTDIMHNSVILEACMMQGT
ncbi:hypothetical protein EDC52_102628 [Biostraticola tofi]|uniref:Uncharacterized protein n=1 Tax=Biostraticola tofi TaxID=466109 RepID=A0A4V6P496_9GAMM|nr:hypothetical protein EDC52_102628 [Biostraticola tofi]